MWKCNEAGDACTEPTGPGVWMLLTCGRAACTWMENEEWVRLMFKNRWGSSEFGHLHAT